MSNIEDAIERIKVLECPTGKLENRIAGILEDYGVANGNQVKVQKYEGLDLNESEGYCVNIPGVNNQSIIVVANSGMDDYVTKVTDVCIK